MPAFSAMKHRPPRSDRFRLVQSAPGKLAVGWLAALAFACAAAAPAQAQISFGLCGKSNEFACGHLTVPLDPSGATPGTITLAMRRHRAPVGEARSAVIALAGGPGQAAIPFAENFDETLGPIIATRDLIVFDQRGTGFSHPLSCHAFETPGQFRTSSAIVAECGGQLGPARAFYTTADSVADIEAIRQAGGYEKLVLYGTSYGTKVAELYAQKYPEHVEALVLDSVVPPNGPDPLNRATYAAIPRVLRQLCAGGACAHVTPEPVADLARLVRRMHRGPLRGRWIDGNGEAHTVRVGPGVLTGLLLAGDFSPLLRAEFITAVRSASESDMADLARLYVSAVSGGGSNEGTDSPLYFATTCEEEDFPWSRAASPGTRLAQAKAAIAAQPASAFAPFTAANVLGFGDFEECSHWPYTTPAPPPVEGSLPNVPTLILSGTADLRTPTANAQAVAAMIPDAQLLVVPYAGHSVLNDEPTPCAEEALQAQFAGKSMKPCPAFAPPAILHPPPLPPRRLADVPAAKGYRGTVGRTLTAVGLTLADFVRQFTIKLLESLGSGSPSSLGSLRSGGLRAGWVQLREGKLVFHGYSYVPGVTITGAIESGKAILRVGGSAAAPGILRLNSHRGLTGTLGGHSVRLPAGAGVAGAIVSSDAQASLHLGRGGSAARAARAHLRELAGLLGRLPWPELHALLR
jgi:pimeloyl-ACP methyl ester carboxylesterase